jgi:hypothetical protein
MKSESVFVLWNVKTEMKTYYLERQRQREREREKERKKENQMITIAVKAQNTYC